MYCENCGHIIGENHLFCEECGFKVNKILSESTSRSVHQSNKTVWIVLGCVLGGLLLIFIIGFILSFFLIVSNVNESINKTENYDYVDIKDHYLYRDDNIRVKNF